jgi:hypothetical protein
MCIISPEIPIAMYQYSMVDVINQSQFLKKSVCGGVILSRPGGGRYRFAQNISLLKRDILKIFHAIYS